MWSQGAKFFSLRTAWRWLPLGAWLALVAPGAGVAGTNAVGLTDLGRYMTARGLGEGSYTLRDSSGRLVGTAQTTGSRTVLRDSSGRMTGSISTSGNQSTFRDAAGRYQGGASAGSSSSTVTYRDATGRLVGSANVSGGGQAVFRDSAGRLSGAAQPSGSGVGATLRDSSGRLVGSVAGTSKVPPERPAKAGKK